MSAAPNHTDLARDLGRLEGEMASVKDSLDRIEAAMSKGFEDIGKRLTQLEAKENQRKGALALLMVLSGVIGGALVKIVSMMVGGN